MKTIHIALFCVAIACLFAAGEASKSGSRKGRGKELVCEPRLDACDKFSKSKSKSGSKKGNGPKSRVPVCDIKQKKVCTCAPDALPDESAAAPTRRLLGKSAKGRGKGKGGSKSKSGSKSASKSRSHSKSGSKQKCEEGTHLVCEMVFKKEKVRCVREDKLAKYLGKFPEDHLGTSLGVCDRDECADGNNNCHEHATCTNEAGCGWQPASFSCKCNCGYEGDGVTCTKCAPPTFNVASAKHQIACDAPEPAIPEITATGNCGQSLPVKVSVKRPSLVNCHGIRLQIVFTTTDCLGRSIKGVITYINVDNVAPVFLDAPADVTVACRSDVPATPIVTASDNCVAKPIQAQLVRRPRYQTCGGKAVLMWRAIDNCKNIATATQTVTITQDTTAPVISHQGDIPANPAGPFPKCEEVDRRPKITAKDDCQTKLKLSNTISAEEVNTDLNRVTIHHRYAAKEGCGNLATASSTTTCETACAHTPDICGAGYSCESAVFNAEGAYHTCVDVDECATGTDNCDANAACTNTDGSFTCKCNTGYSGDGVTCTDIDECAIGANNCDANAACTNTPGSFTCACNAGYSGDGVTCADIDECATGANNCDANAVCSNTDGSFDCECNTGYEGDGVTCADVNECDTGANNCDANAACSNTVGSFTCACDPGYSGDGVACADVDECATGANNCHADADCINTDGSFECDCKPGFSGDGVDCQALCPCAEGCSWYLQSLGSDAAVQNAITTSSAHGHCTNENAYPLNSAPQSDGSWNQGYGGAWCPASASSVHTLTTTFDQPRRLAGVAVQGRGQAPNPHQQYVSEFSLTTPSGALGSFAGTPSQAEIDVPAFSPITQTWANSVAFNPTRWNSWPSVRLDFLVCNPIADLAVRIESAGYEHQFRSTINTNGFFNIFLNGVNVIVDNNNQFGTGPAADDVLRPTPSYAAVARGFAIVAYNRYSRQVAFKKVYDTHASGAHSAELANDVEAWTAAGYLVFGAVRDEGSRTIGAYRARLATATGCSYFNTFGSRHSFAFISVDGACHSQHTKTRIQSLSVLTATFNQNLIPPQ